MITVHADKDCEKCHGEGWYWERNLSPEMGYRCSELKRCDCWIPLYPQYYHRIKAGEEYEILPAKKENE